MKNNYRVFYIKTVTAILFVFSLTAEANWTKTNNNTSIHSNNSDTQNSNRSDSLPDGVTEDWLSNLKDESGNRIVPDPGMINSKSIYEDPEGDAMQRMIFNGLASNYSFGNSVSSAGDVNGDGYDDIIVGASGYNTNTGRAYIYFGGLIMNTVADLILTGESTNSYFGYSVSSAGDLNGDGYSDVIVGAYGYSSTTGRAYVYYGGPVMNNTADLFMSGESSSNNFGISVSSAGDVNGDGYADALIGAYGYSTNTGRAYLYYGGSSMNNIVDVIFNGQSSLNYFGLSVSSAGDINSDGFSDVIVGAFGYSSSTGRAYLYFGGTSMNNVADVTMTGETTNSGFGRSVSSAGDVNGDGYSDVIVGANLYSTNTGRAYVFFGGSSMNNISDVVMTGESTNTGFGISVSTAGDINGDGYSDVIIGANVYSSNTGRVYVYFGGSLMNNISDVVITGETSFSHFGASVSTAGDVNGDGYSDLIVGAFGYLGNTGRVYLYDYFMKNEITHDLSLTGETDNNVFGFSVSSAGDVNGDGYSDIIVGANGYSSGTGRAYVYFGGASMNNVADVTMTGEATNNSFGTSVSSAGDVNGDGYSDIIVGADAYSSNTGRAYIYFGGAAMNNAADVTMTGGGVNNSFGTSVSSAGDVNGDGYSDVIVGAGRYSSFTGRAYIYFGGAAMNNAADVTMAGETTSNNFGFSVSSAGDVNGDGYSDVIVGADLYSSSTGRAYIYYGGAAMNNAADVIMTGETISSNFGFSVSSAGDVNGDGYSDVIIGAFEYSSSTGRSYIYFGGSLMNNIADVTMTGETINSGFGISVSAGDVNGDGYSDVIVGADGYSANTGRVYIYFGGSAMNNAADVTMTGVTTVNIFGYSASSVGDVNGDGYSDILVGAFGYSSFTGRAYLYYGSAISAKPILNYVKDVPNDQGGFVDLKWARSSFDVIGMNLITDYVVQRSAPPSGGNFAWVNLEYIPATKEPFYSSISATPYDSSSNSNGTFFFRITARTSDVNQFWRSAILSGKSIDNIAPLMVSPFTAAASGSNVNLNWGGNSAPDLLNYVLFRSTNPTIDPYTETPLATSVTTAFTDTDPLIGLYYYFIVAQDIHGNYSPVATAVSPFFTINLTMFIEGFYNAGSNTQVSDTLNTYLRNISSPYNIVDNSKAVVSSIGKADLKFSNAANGNYYLSIKHRNSIETWSSSGITVTGGSSVNFNLTYLITQAYGSNQIQIDAAPLRYGIYSGDVNQDGTIDIADGSLIDNDGFNFVSGYVPTDVNGDGIVDVADAVFADNNGFNFVSKITP